MLTMRGSFIRVLFVAFACVCLLSQAKTASAQDTPHRYIAILEAATAVNGTFAGESICVRGRPTCKNEKVIYVFESAQDGSEVLLTSDFIQGRLRVPFFRQKLQYDPRVHYFSGRFLTARDTASYGYDSAGRRYTIAITATDANALEGTISLTDTNTVVRRIKLRRVKPNQVPPAPSPSMYQSL